MNIAEVKSVLGDRFARHADFVAETLAGLKLTPSLKVLDVGTGWGTMAIILALQGLHVITGEPEGANWADWQTQAKKIQMGDAIEFRPFSAEALPFADGEFYGVFALNSLHHMQDQTLALNEFFRVVQPGGLILIFEMNKDEVKNVKKSKPNHPEAIDPQNYVGHNSFTLQVNHGLIMDAFIFTKSPV